MRIAPVLLLLLAACATVPPGNVGSLERAPWDSNPSIVAPQVVLDEWRGATNRAGCAPLSFADAGESGLGGIPRRANFSGGWGVSWDVPGQPGRDASGAACASCGRGTFGIAGTGIDWDAPSPVLANRMEWSGGNLAAYGPEGGSGPGWLAQVRVADQRCMYNVWSYAGREHLEHLLRNIRRVRE
jgi:hypothetical protein